MTAEQNNTSNNNTNNTNNDADASNLNINDNATTRPKVALITGITGQDGSYLAELLLSKGYIVYGIVRRTSTTNTQRIEHILKNNKNLFLETGDLLDSNNLFSIISKTKPDEIYNLAAQSHVKVSFDQPEFTANVDGLGTLRLLESIRSSGLINTTKFYQASTSEMFGKVVEPLQSEKTPFYPRSPYGVAKVFAHWMTINYRESYGLFACNGILFNHESPRRGTEFVTRKISLAVAKIHLGLQEDLSLGNLSSRRDWGHAKDYVEGMWLMLQQDKPDDYVLSSGTTYAVKEFVERAFDAIGIKIYWRGEGVNEQGYQIVDDGKEEKKEIIRVKVNPQFYRPAEVDFLLGDNSKAKKVLGWEIKVSFKELVRDMVQSDIDALKQQQTASFI